MASNRKVKRRLKKGVLTTLIFFLISLIFLFVVIVKATTNSTVIEDKETDNVVSVNTENRTDRLSGDKITENKNNSEILNKEENTGKTVVVIDPAFGGEYAGSKGCNGILQKDVNLNIALNIKNTLSRYEDVEVYLTRDSDKTVSYKDRISLIKEKKADVVVSIQQNTEGSGKAEGVETYILNKSDYPKSNSSLGYNIQKAMNMYSDSVNRGVMTRNIEILKDSYTSIGATGAVVYTGFITNEKESKKLTDKKYVEKLSEGIAQGILTYIDKINSEKNN